MTGKPRILFACRANAGRSVTAKVLTEHYAQGAVEVFSAGSEPADTVHAEVATALAKLGMSTDEEVPKRFDPHAHFDVVVTMGCGEACPVYAGARFEDWEIDDPKGQDEATVRRVVDDVDARVRRLLGDLLPHLSLPPSVVETTADGAR